MHACIYPVSTQAKDCLVHSSAVWHICWGICSRQASGYVYKKHLDGIFLKKNKDLFYFKSCVHVCASVGLCACVNAGVCRGQREQWNP